MLDLVVASPRSDFFVVDEEGNYLGAISVSALRRLIFDQDALRTLVVAADLVEQRPTVTEDDDLDTVMQLLADARATELAVVDADAPGRVVGAVLQNAVREAYNRETLERDLAGGVGSRVDLAGRGQTVHLGDEFVLTELDLPIQLVGHSLRQVDLRARTGVQVVLLRRPSSAEAPIRVPSADDLLQAGDMMVVAGREDAVVELSRQWSRLGLPQSEGPGAG